ncbi:MAG: 50S ribosomal protein L29 [Planctomycetota bacterium]|nr:50S ribosomal protein L29 [Planctomycetota bacterium]
MKAKVLRETASDELREMLQDSEEELFNLRFQGATEEIKNPAGIPKIRRNVARIKTILAERGESEVGPTKRTASKEGAS